MWSYSCHLSLDTTGTCICCWEEAIREGNE
jgi:hypothetical protein